MDKTLCDLNNEQDKLPDTQYFETLVCDLEKYRPYLEGFNLSSQEEAEILEMLWKIMATFVDLGFGVDSIQFLPKEELLPHQKVPRLTGVQGSEGDNT